MKFLIFSDIHGDLRSLEQLLARPRISTFPPAIFPISAVDSTDAENYFVRSRNVCG